MIYSTVPEALRLAVFHCSDPEVQQLLVRCADAVEQFQTAVCDEAELPPVVRRALHGMSNIPVARPVGHEPDAN